MKNYLMIVPAFLLTAASAFATSPVYNNAANQGNANHNAIWPTLNLSLCWEDYGQTTQRYRDLMYDTYLDGIAANSDLNITGWNECGPHGADIRVKVADEGAHTKTLGKYLKNMPNGMVINDTYIKWNPSCRSRNDQCSKGIFLHELLHSLGYSHEHNRSDTPSSCKEPPQGMDGGVYIGPWDKRSIMNYCADSYLNNFELSQTDKLMLRLYYSGLNTPEAKLAVVVNRYYFTLLGRSPDEGGKQYWISQLKNQGCSATSIGNIGKAMTEGDEFAAVIEKDVQTKGEEKHRPFAIVKRLYQALLNRTPLPHEPHYWATQWNNHVKSRTLQGVPLLQARKEATVHLIATIESQPEFHAIVARSCNIN